MSPGGQRQLAVDRPAHCPDHWSVHMSTPKMSAQSHSWLLQHSVSVVSLHGLCPSYVKSFSFWPSCCCRSRPWRFCLQSLQWLLEKWLFENVRFNLTFQHPRKHLLTFKIRAGGRRGRSGDQIRDRFMPEAKWEPVLKHKQKINRTEKLILLRAHLLEKELSVAVCMSDWLGTCLFVLP